MNKADYLNSQISIEKVLKAAPKERSEVIYLVNKDGRREGPYIRKTFTDNIELGDFYKSLYNDKKMGMNCENVPDVYYVDSQDSKIVVIIQYYEGISLDKYMKKNYFDIDLFNNIFKQICDAIDYMHTAFSHPIIHSELTAANILINEQTNKIMLADCGVARKNNNGTKTGSFRISKIVNQSKKESSSKLDVKTDIYSLGKLLKFMMDGKNWENNKAEFPNDIYFEIVEKATNSDPKKRYNSVNSMIIEFHSAKSGGAWVKKIADNKTIIIFGHIWNFLLTIAYFCYACGIILAAMGLFGPLGINISIGEKIIYCIVSILFIMYPIYFILLFKPSLRRIIKGFPRLKAIHYFAFAICSASVVLVLALFAQLF